MNTGLTELQMNILTQTCARYPEIERFVIFGSRAKGNYKPGADIDTFLTISLDWVEKAWHNNETNRECHAYDKHVNAVMIQNDVLGTARLEGLAEGRIEGILQGKEEGRAEGLAEGVERGRAEGILAVARKMKAGELAQQL